MTEEEYFIKNYPDSCYGDRPLSPYWDYFQDGVEFGERQSEKKIEELKEKHKQEILDLVLSNSSERAELEKENAELKKESDFYHKERGEYKGAFIKQVVETNKVNKQLTKAKELLKNILALSVHDKKQCTYDAYILTVKEAEQFLQEIEK